MMLLFFNKCHEINVLLKGGATQDEIVDNQTSQAVVCTRLQGQARPQGNERIGCVSWRFIYPSQDSPVLG